MRLLAPLLITWTVLSSSLADVDPFGSGSNRNSKDIKIFRVSKTGKNKDLLLRLFESIRSQEGKTKFQFRKKLLVRQRISSTTYLVSGQGRDHLRGGDLSYDAHYWFVSKKPLDKVDGDTIDCLGKVTDEVKSYTSVGAGKKTVRVIKEVYENDLNLPQPLTQEKFVEELKAGKTWTVTLVDKCKTCGGSGKLKSVSGTRACNSCSGSRDDDPFGGFERSGSGELRVTYSVRW